jgi:hypothetical protein
MPGEGNLRYSASSQKKWQNQEKKKLVFEDHGFTVSPNGRPE